MPRATNFSGCSMGSSTTSRIFSICSLQPPMSEYVTSGFSSTVIMVTVGSIFGGSGIWIWYLVRSTLHSASPGHQDNLLTPCVRGGGVDVLARGCGIVTHPTRMPSSISVGATLSPKPTTNCITTST